MKFQNSYLLRNREIHFVFTFTQFSFSFRYMQFNLLSVTKMLKNSPNAKLNKVVLDRYRDLEMPEGSLIATYIWIDGTGENLRCKDRTITSIPKSAKGELKSDQRLKDVQSIKLKNKCSS